MTALKTLPRSVTLLLGALLVAGIAACSGDDGNETATDDAETSAEETAEGTAGEIIDVAFDGSECTYAGPSEVQPGDYTFLFTDTSDLRAELFARFIRSDHTYQDALDAQEAAGGPGSYWPRPSWAASVAYHSDRPEIDLADNQQLLPISLSPGNHFLAVYSRSPEGIWLCTPLDVVQP